jgi:peroxiredoxin
VSPNIGEAAPLFRLPTQRGVSTSLGDVLRRGAALIAFPGRVSVSFRAGGDEIGSGVADRRVQALARVYQRLEHAGIGLLVIVPNSQTEAKRYVEDVGTPFHLLCGDDDVTTRYGVRLWSLMPGRPDTRPALFGIDAEGRIRYRFLADWHADARALQEAIDTLSFRKTDRPNSS